MHREITKHLAAIFDTTGISIHPQGHEEKRAIRLITTWLMVFGATMMLLYLITHRHAFQDVALSSCCLISATNAILVYLILHFKSEHIRQLLVAMDDDIFAYADESEITPNYSWTSYDRYMKIVSLVIIGYIYACMAFLGLSSVLMVLFGGMGTAFMYPAWTPWNSIVLDFLSQMTTLLAFGCSYSLTYVYMLTISFEFERQSERLCAALASMESRARAKVDSGLGGTSPELYSEFMRENLVQCVKHHQKLIRAFTLFNSWSAITFSIRLGSYTLMLILAIFTLFEPITLQYKAPMCVAIVFALFESFSWAYVGNKFSIISDRVSSAIFYQVVWYEQPMKIRRLLILFHLLVKSRSFTILGFSVIGAGYSTFAQICRISYSYVNMLKSVF